MDIYHWVPDTSTFLFKIGCMVDDSHLTDFALWHLAWILSVPLGLQVGTIQLVTGNQRCLKRCSNYVVSLRMGGIPAKSYKGEKLLLFMGIIDILQSYR